MTHDYPLLLTRPPPPARADRPAAATAESACRYPVERRSRLRLALAMLISASVHAGLILAIRPAKKVVRPIEGETVIQLMVAPVVLKELEEPEPVPSEAEAPPDPGTLVPMQQDLPQLARPNDFVQAIDLSTLLAQPDFSAAKVFTIPDHIARGTAKLGEGLVIFNLADLDRAPEPVMQPAPVFPRHLKHEVTEATVQVEFLVEVDGRVSQAFAVRSTHLGFEEPAITGVKKWRFRAGIKGGRKVITRMSVPIIFKLLEHVE
jgi:protein TonB